MLGNGNEQQNTYPKIAENNHPSFNKCYNVGLVDFLANLLPLFGYLQ